MLYAVNSGQYVEAIPHREAYQACCNRLTPDEVEGIKEEIRRRIEGSEVNTSSWLPGRFWDGSPFEPIYRACQRNETLAACCFGIFVWDVLMTDPDNVWGFGRYEANGIPIQGLTYFVLSNPPPR